MRRGPLAGQSEVRVLASRRLALKSSPMKQPRFTEQQIDFLLRHAAVVPDNDAGVAAPVDVDVITEDGAENGRDPGADPAPTANGAAAATPVDATPPLDAQAETEPREFELAPEEFSPPPDDTVAIADAIATLPDALGSEEATAPETLSQTIDASAAADVSIPEDAPVPADVLPPAFESSEPEEPSASPEASAPDITVPPPTQATSDISPNTFDLFRKKYAGLSLEDMSRLQKLEDENSRLRELIARLIVERQPTPESYEEASEPAMPSFMAKSPGATFTSTELAPYDFDAGSTAMTLAAEDARSDAIDAARYSARQAVATIGEAWTNARGSAVRFAARARDVRPGASVPVVRQSAGRAAVRLKTAIRSAPDIRNLSWGEARRIAAGAAKDARRKSKGREILLAGIAGGLVAGFAVGIKSSPLDETETVMLPVDTSVRLNSFSSVSGSLAKGWDKPQPWGAWMVGSQASVMIGVEGPSRGDVELLIEGKTQPVQGVDPPTITVRFNDAELGRWRLPAQAGPLRRRFIVPAAIFNRGTDARVSFELPSTPASSVFGVQALSLRDVRFLANFRGFVDTCTREMLGGWAVADGAPVSVVASVDGKPIAAEWTNLDRDDLASRKIPADAGFVLKPQTPIAAGSKVELRFANGRPLNGSPCKP
jgi:hypothetical protein